MNETDEIRKKQEENPSEKLALEIFKFLVPMADVDTSIILTALSITLATVSVEAGIEEEKAVYAFRKSYGHANRRFKRLLKPAGGKTNGH
jgi:hypothetical protein